MTLASMKDELLADLSIIMKNDPNFDADVLSVKIKNAIKEVRMRRSYENTSWTEEQIVSDLYNNYYSVISKLATYDYNQVGVEGQVSHQEGGDNRQWSDREKLFNGVHSFVGII